MVYQLTEPLVADRIAELLQREGAESIVGFPENRLLNSASLVGMRPIITRTERVAVNIADGFARATNGERIAALRHPVRARCGVGVRRRRPGLRRPQPDPALPGEHAVADQDSAPNFRIEQAYRPITRWARHAERRRARGPELFRRALNAVRGVRNGPVLVALANDVLNGPPGDADWSLPPIAARRSQAAPERRRADRAAAAGASSPVILAGQGVLYARRHRRAGGAGRARPARRWRPPSTARARSPRTTRCRWARPPAPGRPTVDRFFERADLILGVGTSFTRSLYITPLPTQATLGQIVDDPRDLGSGYDVEFGCVGDARLVLAQLRSALGRPERPDAARTAAEVAAARAAFREAWLPQLQSDDGAAQPLPDRVGADAGRRPHPHRCHP